MTHEFPIIERIDDILPAIEGRDEFFVAEREGFKVANYRVAFTDTFDIDETDLMLNHGKEIPKGIMRRELRGIIFDADGYIMSRPFHKFFNVGERLETRMANIDLSQPHAITEKMDGSMIRPLRINGEIRLGTKMGFSDVAEAAQKIVSEHQLEWMAGMMDKGITPLFEFISPKNRVVVEYDHAELVLLALRENRTGDYLDISECRESELFRVVPEYGSVDGSLDAYIARQRGAQGREGDVLTIGNMRYKIKNDWYVCAHKTKEAVREDHHILALLLENELDDVLPTMSEKDVAHVRTVEADFHRAYGRTLASLRSRAGAAVSEADGDRRALATRIIPKHRFSKMESRFVFGLADGNDMNDMLMEAVKSSLVSKARFDKMAAYLHEEHPR